MPEEIYWIWMQQALGIGSIKTDKVLDTVGSARSFYEMDGQALRETGFLTAEEIASVRTASLDDAKRAFERAGRLRCRVVTPDHPDYPPYFTHIPCRPCVLYVLGELSASVPLSITVVGTRRCTGEGRAAAHQLSRDLAAAGCQVVSGLAVGIDQAAHEGALSVHGRTVGFLACGMKVDYPGGSAGLKRRILDDGGALASEFPFDAPARPAHFHIRNRLMAGLSDGTLVVQAKERSGALITAGYAVDQNREVFAVPGSIYDQTMVGCNRLIRDGCTAAVNVYSILEAYSSRFSEQERARMAKAIRQVSGIAPESETKCVSLKRKRKLPEQELPKPALSAGELENAGVSHAAGHVYGALEETPVNCDELAARTGLSAREVMSALTELELFGLAVPEPGMRYRR